MISDRQVTSLLRELGYDATDVEPIGTGAWSTCFGFDTEARELVIRLGRHVEDFEKDRLAHRFADPRLPIPEVLDIGEAFDVHYVVSTRARGAPLEESTAPEWVRLVPTVTDALEVMRAASVPERAGWGGWDGAGRAGHPTWRDHLLAVDHDGPDRRTHGGHQKLKHFRAGREAFDWGYRLLAELDVGPVPRGLVHGDLINANVHVAGATITGVFDWGCACYGDHLYDLAWFEFWSPWHPNLDVDLLHESLLDAWRADGYAPASSTDRLLACHLHIGLDHLVYNAHLGRGSAIDAVVARMTALVDGLSS